VADPRIQAGGILPAPLYMISSPFLRETFAEYGDAIIPMIFGIKDPDDTGWQGEKNEEK
jgi:hypothetical protein